MTPEQLKASILQYAIQGKLVEQRPEEGTGEELYQQIQKEKQQLIKDGKIKSRKPLPEITEDEIPFDIPKTWKWVRLGEMASINGGFAFKSANYTTEGIRVIRIADFNEEGFVNDRIVRYPYDNLLSQYVLDVKNILLCMTGGTVGKSLFVTKLDEKMVVNQRVATIKVEFVSPEYVYKIILAPITQKVIRNSKNSTNDNISMDIIKCLLIPLPPITEQKRIVAKIDKLLTYVNYYAVAYEKLEQLNAKFPENMKKSVLQYAIQGKLVEQRPEEGTGEELYQQIQEEKKRLIMEGKIKKEKPLPEIAEDEIPFDIPESWRWCYVGELFSHNTGKAMNSSARKIDKLGATKPFITTSNVYWNNFDFSTVKEMFFLDDEVERFTVTKGDILMCEGGAYFGRTAIWNYDYDICFQNHLHRLRPYQEIDLMFFYYIFFFYKSINIMRAKGTAIPGLSSITLHQMVIPLPPLAEQKRIVARLEEILPLCERLK